MAALPTGQTETMGTMHFVPRVLILGEHHSHLSLLSLPAWVTSSKYFYLPSCVPHRVCIVRTRGMAGRLQLLVPSPVRILDGVFLRVLVPDNRSFPQSVNGS